MLGMEKELDKPNQVWHERLDNTVSKNLRAFAEKMFETSRLSTNQYAKIVLRMWDSLFHSLSGLANDTRYTRNDYSGLNTQIIAAEINQSLDRVRECMSMLKSAFEEIDPDVVKLCSSAAIGLCFDIAGSHDDRKYTVRRRHTISSKEEFLVYVSSIAEKMCHTIRILHCSDNNFYIFLGTEEAKNHMISSFGILDPSHDNPTLSPAAIEPKDYDGT
jgi:hypothetical protein